MSKEKKEKSVPEYEVLNVANEVVFTGIAPECLAYCRENMNIANTVHEKTKKGLTISAGVWVWLASKVEDVIKRREEKQKKKEEKKNARKQGSSREIDVNGSVDA